MKSIAVSQSNYIPWKGYFDQIARVDEFVIYDSVQYTRRDWRNRNKIKTPHGLQWMTIPVNVKGKYFQSIFETTINDKDWASRHLKAISLNYSKSLYYQDIYPVLETAYLKCSSEFLSEVNIFLLRTIARLIGLKTKFTLCRDYVLENGKSERLLSICMQAGASIYFSGPAARKYLDHELFQQHGVQIQYMDYGHYPEYSQLWGKYVHEVSIIDLLMNCGPSAANYLKYFNI